MPITFQTDSGRDIYLANSPTSCSKTNNPSLITKKYVAVVLLKTESASISSCLTFNESYWHGVWRLQTNCPLRFPVVILYDRTHIATLYWFFNCRIARSAIFCNIRCHFYYLRKKRYVSLKTSEIHILSSRNLDIACFWVLHHLGWNLCK